MQDDHVVAIFAGSSAFGSTTPRRPGLPATAARSSAYHSVSTAFDPDVGLVVGGPVHHRSPGRVLVVRADEVLEIEDQGVRAMSGRFAEPLRAITRYTTGLTALEVTPIVRHGARKSGDSHLFFAWQVTASSSSFALSTSQSPRPTIPTVWMGMRRS